MIEYKHTVAGQSVTVHVPQTSDDLDEFKRWFSVANELGPVALDTETTGLDIFSTGYRLRTVQFGDAVDAWVLHWERGGWFAEVARWALRRLRHVLIHNAPFDWLVLDRHAGIPLETLAKVTTDTKLLAALVDPRQPQEGGVGTGLKPLSAHYVDASAPDTQGDLTQVFRSLKLTKATGWAGIPLDHPTYNLYAGLDVILTARLFPCLTAELDHLGVRRALVEYEHELARICSVMTRTGMVLDLDYTDEMRTRLRAEEAYYAQIAESFGVASINSGKQVGDALIAMGVPLTQRTAGGAIKVDKAVLLALSDMSMQWERLGVHDPNPLAEAVVRAKRAGKWCTTYADTFQETVDSSGRVHPHINTMAARTGRMSITRPALQTLPSSDQMIRRALLADEGEVIISTDFAAVEMRVLAALADVKMMKKAILAGEDLHDFTASLVWGPEFTTKQRKIGKGIGFGKVYGGGADAVAAMTGAPVDDVRSAMGMYDRVYPEIRRAGNRWQREARANGMVTVTVTGRRLPLDRDRAYAVTNYQVQSAARDVLGQALIEMDERGLLPYLRLPIHDEVLASAPKAEAAEIARAIEQCMCMTLAGVPISATADIGGRSWGSLYGSDY